MIYIYTEKYKCYLLKIILLISRTIPSYIQPSIHPCQLFVSSNLFLFIALFYIILHYIFSLLTGLFSVWFFSNIVRSNELLFFQACPAIVASYFWLLELCLAFNRVILIPRFFLFSNHWLHWPLLFFRIFFLKMRSLFSLVFRIVQVSAPCIKIDLIKVAYTCFLTPLPGIEILTASLARKSI